MQIQFDKLKKETGLLSGAIQTQVAHEAPLTARLVQPKVLAEKVIGSEIEPDTKEKEEQYEDVFKGKDKLDQARAVSPQMASVIRWNVPCLYQ